MPGCSLTLGLLACIVLLNSLSYTDVSGIHKDIMIDTEFLEGVETDIVCSVMYKCPGDRPYITWNGGQLPGSMSFVPGAQQEARSTLKFTARATDHGKVLTCFVEFKGSVQTERITLKVRPKPLLVVVLCMLIVITIPTLNSLPLLKHCFC
uniref:Si:dkey-238d18.10 n=1 Tax=Pygocentrus nattereri TaxID=42514 RepID=A0AAR2JBE2_PYGNA